MFQVFKINHFLSFIHSHAEILVFFINKTQGPITDQVSLDVKDKGSICKINHISKEEPNTVIFDNITEEYILTMKHSKKITRDIFSG